MRHKVALIGAGAIAPFHVGALRASGFEVAHIAARPGSQRARLLSEELDIPRYWDDPIDLIRSPEWDAIVLACATEEVPNLLIEVVAQGRPCLVEKPVSFDPQVIQRFEAADEFIRVAYNRRFYAAAAGARNFAASRTCNFRLELPDSIQDVMDTDDGLRSVRENSVHGLDLLRFIVGPYQIAQRLDTDDPRSRVALVTTDRGHIGTIVLNWNVPANFALVLDHAPQRYEMKPFEMGSLYEGMEVLEPSQDIPVRRYVPRLVSQISSFPGPDGVKPGFREQADSLRMRLESDRWDDRSATLHDAAAASRMATELTQR